MTPPDPETRMTAEALTLRPWWRMLFRLRSSTAPTPARTLARDDAAARLVRAQAVEEHRRAVDRLMLRGRPGG